MKSKNVFVLISAKKFWKYFGVTAVKLHGKRVIANVLAGTCAVTVEKNGYRDISATITGAQRKELSGISLIAATC